jgi:hypothetical protein
MQCNHRNDSRFPRNVNAIGDAVLFAVTATHPAAGERYVHAFVEG